MKIVLAGGYDTKNLGDHMALVGLVKALEPEKLTVLMRHPEHELPVECRKVQNLDYASKADSAGKVFRGFNSWEENDYLRRVAPSIDEDEHYLDDIRESIYEADALLLGGGRMFIDICYDFLRGPIPYFAELVKLARWCGTPVWLVNNTWVPVENDEARRTVEWIRAMADVDLYREGPHGRARVCQRVPDLAYCMSEGDVKRTGNRTGVCLRYSEHLDWMIDYVEAMGSSQRDFIPQQTYAVDTWKTDDRAVSAIAASRIGGQVVSELTISSAMSVYEGCGLVLSSRRHGLVMAACRGVPAIAMALEQNTVNAALELNTPWATPGRDQKYVEPVNARDRALELWEQSLSGYRAARDGA